jgi:hypothetical protein
MVWLSSRLKEMAIVRFVYRIPPFPPFAWWHLAVLNYWFILYGLLNSFEHCQINFTALLNITDLFGSKWWSRLVLWKGVTSCISAIPELQYAHGFHGQTSSHSLVSCRSSLIIMYNLWASSTCLAAWITSWVLCGICPYGLQGISEKDAKVSICSALSL